MRNTPKLPRCHTPRKARHWLCCLLLAAALGWALPSPAQTPDAPAKIVDTVAEKQTKVSLVVVIIALLLLQTVLILGLQRSRVKSKHAEENLKRSQHALEQRVIERTNKLRAINNQLYEEIAQHEITEERLQEAQGYLQSIINSMPSVLIGVTRDGYITHWNSAAEQATDIPASHAVGKRLNDISPGLNVEDALIHNSIDQGVTQVKEGIRHEFGGQVGYTDLIIYPLIAEDTVGAVIRIDDVTMRVRFENMMIQNEKMMSLGELAAGMAHEINNPLSAILHAVQNIRRRTSASLPANEQAASQAGLSVEQLKHYMENRGVYNFLDSIKEAGERAARIVTNMLEFSRSSRRHEPVDIIKLLEHSLELSHNSFNLRTAQGGKSVQIHREFQPDLPLVPCSAAEIEQVILNILRNGAQAFSKDGEPKDGESKDGEPKDEESKNEKSDTSPAITIRAFAEGDMVKIQIADNGPGMPEATRRHIFEPFFTTKDVGKGTGLGLSVSYFIVTEHHNGQIEVESSEGRGTTFTISLPIVEDDDVSEPRPPARLA